MRAAGSVRARFALAGGATRVAALYETGGYRMKFPRKGPCEGVIVNTGGGLAGGDVFDAEIATEAGAEAIITTQSAEKVYRTEGAPARLGVRAEIGADSALTWAPQETLLFDGARLERRLDVEMAETGRLILVESAVFGRLAHGEANADAHLRDRWRIRRAGRLVFAEDSHVRGAADLDRPALGGGARAVATMLLVGEQAAALVEPLREIFGAHAEGGVEAGVSAIDGVLIARALAHDPARLRSAVRDAMTAATGRAPPRVWG